MQDQPQNHGERPYRSHLRPACLSCRRRKSRCQSEADSRVCLMCRAHGTECVYPSDSQAQQPSSAKSTPSAKRRRRSGARQRTPVSGSAPPGVSAPSFRGPAESGIIHSPALNRTRLPNLVTSAPPLVQSSAGHGILGRDQHNVYDENPFDSSADDDEHNLHIVGPAVTKDSQVLSDYLSAIPDATRGTRMFLPVPANRSKPVLFTRVQKRPVGISVNRSPSAEKLNIIEHLIGPLVPDVIDVYFRKVNPCIPIVDEVLFRRQYQINKDRISPALIAALLAHTLVHWNFSKTLSNHRHPDSRLIWNLANEAVYSELRLSPGMSIIKAILLDVGGLPTTSPIANGMLLGSAVSMAHSLGLNNDPLPWEISHLEKCLRMKIWWTLLVHDRWKSLAHGTPPQIFSTQYDVPPPTLEYMLCDNLSVESHRRTASIFIGLVTLTDVLGQHLEYIYNVNKDERNSTTNLELALNNWVESLTGTVRLIILRGSHLDVPGASNLRLSYLTTRLLLQRIELESDKHIYEHHDRRLINRYIQARRTAEDILLLTQELKPDQLGDFWLSTHAFSYPATVNFLLRCGLETENSPAELVQSSSFRIAHDLINTLRSHKEKYSWELADVCLAQHADIVDKILASVSSHDSQGITGAFDPEHEFVMPDVSIIDQFCPNLWDPLQNAW